MSMIPRSALLAAIVLSIHPLAGLSQVGKLPPSDEAVRDPGLFAARAQLQAAVARHDAAAVLESVDPRIKTDFGGGGGAEGLRKRLAEAGSPTWGELGAALALGGSFQNADTFVFPYVYGKWPESLDAFEHVAVLGNGVRVRAEPRAESPVLAKLSFDIVKRSSAGKPPPGWTAVQLRDGRKGYIASRYARGPVDYRGFLTRANGAWRLTLFVAGD
jgi:hypothetical protein